VPADLFAPVHSVGLWYTEGRGSKAADAAEARRFDDELTYSGVTGRADPMARTPVLSWGQGVRPMVPFGPAFCRSALGMALMQVTENSIVDVADIEAAFRATELDLTPGHLHVPKKGVPMNNIGALASLAESDHERALVRTSKDVRVLWGKALERDARLAPKQFAYAHPKSKAKGLPLDWIDRFRRLRRAIEKSGTGSDGGVALWLVYQDLLVSAFDRRYLTANYIEFLFSRQARAANKYITEELTSPKWFSSDQLFRHNPDDQVIESDDIIAAPPTWIWFEDPCPHMATKMVTDLVDKWRRTIHPKYAQGQKRMASLGVSEGEVRGHARSVGEQRAAATTPERRRALDKRRAMAAKETDEQRLAALRQPVAVIGASMDLAAAPSGISAGGKGLAIAAALSLAAVGVALLASTPRSPWPTREGPS
jgi:hypothetical protein